MKPDVVITTIAGYSWEQIRPFAISLVKSGFYGIGVILAAGMDPFVLECLQNRRFKILQFALESRPFVTHARFVPLLRFLARHKHEYRYVIWADAGDQIFQSNPSAWLERHIPDGQPTLIAARECWKIQDELQWNDPWAKATVPEEYDWLRQQEVLCGGTIAGDAESVYQAVSQIYQLQCDNPHANDQAGWNYIFHKPGKFSPRTKLIMPTMAEGWTATCSAFDTPSFKSIIGRSAEFLTDSAPVFDQGRGLVLTPDGKTPFALVHQYNRDGLWNQLIHRKYEWD